MFENLIEITAKFLTKIAAFLLIILLIIIFVDVFSRSILSKPILWTQEIALISFIWSVLLGAVIAVKEEEHFYVNIFSKLSKRMLFRMKILTNSLIMLFSIFIFKEGVVLAIMGLKRFSRPSGIPMVYIFGALPVSGILMVLFSANNFIKLFKEDK